MSNEEKKQKFDPKAHEARIQSALDKFHAETFDAQEQEAIKQYAKKKQLTISKQKALQTNVGLAQVRGRF